MTDPALERAAQLLAGAEALMITAGAGMGVDSGLPDFRGTEGFWRAYPAYRALGLDFESMASPQWFDKDPALAWGFYGHRLALYRRTTPHAGFGWLKGWGERMRYGSFVYTSNVDGHFQRAGFDPARLVECHGGLETLQCAALCGAPLFSAEGVDLVVDPETFRAEGPLPTCPRCGTVARPNVLMFDDGAWDGSRTAAQQRRLGAWLDGLESADTAPRLLVIECGAGTAVPTVRLFSEGVSARLGGTLVRINVRESEVPHGHVGLAAGAREVLGALAARS